MVAVAVIHAAMAAAGSAGARNRPAWSTYFLKAVPAGARFFVPSRLPLIRAANYIKRQRSKERGPIRPDDPNAQENIDIPPIPKETAGAVAGAALGSMMGPAGAIVGGIVGAMAGKAASERRLAPAAKKAVARVAKAAPPRRKKKVSRGKAAKRKPAKSRKRSTSKRPKAKPRRRSTPRAKKRRRR